jgi:hypothetical protein
MTEKSAKGSSAVPGRLLLLLSAALLLAAPLAEASVPRTSAVELAPATATSLTLTLAPDEPGSSFALFVGDEVARAAHAYAEGFHPLVAVSLLAEDESPDLASELELREPETRIGGQALFPGTRIGAESRLSLDLRWACEVSDCELVSGNPQDPLGLCEGCFWNAEGDLTEDEARFQADVIGEFAKGVLDPRNAWKNVKRGVGGAVGAGKFVAKTAVGLGSLALDTSPLGPAIPGAIERNENRVAAVKSFIAHPIDTIVSAHSSSFETILAHEQKGEYFSSGAEAGELGAADAAAIYGGASAVGSLARLVRAGAGRLGASLEASSRWPSIVPEGGWEFPTAGSGATPAVAPLSPTAYSTVFEMQLKPTELGFSRAVHSARARAALREAMAADPEHADLLTKAMQTSPKWTWEHASSSAAQGRFGIMRLVPRSQHTPGSPWWRLLHPDRGARGGYSEWAIPAGAPPNR